MPTMLYTFTAAIVLLVIYRIIRQTILDPLRDIPAAPQAPFYRRLLTEPDPKRVELWAREIPNTGLIRYRGSLNQQYILLTDPQAVQDVMITQPYAFRRPPFVAKVLHSILGEGIFVAEGDTHKIQRRLMQQPFKPLRIRNLYPTFEHKATELVETLHSACKNEVESSESVSLDIASYLRRSTLDIIGLAGFGLNFDSLKNPDTELLRKYIQIFEPDKATLRFRILAILLPGWLVRMLPLQRNKDLEAALSVIKVYIGAAIDGRDSQAGLDEKSPDLSPAKKSGDDVVGVLMSESGVRDPDVLISQSMNMLGAGHDTVYGAMIGAVFELSKRPDIQARLRQEIQEHVRTLGDPTGVHISDIDNLPYLAAFCNEVYRFWPPAPFVRRQSSVPVKVADYFLPPQTTFVHCSRVFHRSPELWTSDPQQFDPERWMKDPLFGGAKDKKAFASFGLGPRACIGEKFARAEVKHLVAKLVRSFDISFEGTGPHLDRQELQLEYEITAKLVGGLSVRLRSLEAC